MVPSHFTRFAGRQGVDPGSGKSRGTSDRRSGLTDVAHNRLRLTGCVREARPTTARGAEEVVTPLRARPVRRSVSEPPRWGPGGRKVQILSP